MSFLVVVSECISAYELDHKILVKGFLLSCGIKFDEKPNEIVGKFKDKVSFTFDELNRLVKSLYCVFKTAS